MRRLLLTLATLSAAIVGEASAGFIEFSSAGPDAASIAPTVDAFRAALGALNPNTPGSFPGGRREINWDGVPDTFSDPNPFPGDFFNGNTPGRARGVVFSTPGTGFLVSSNPGTASPPLFGFPNDFQAFSPQKLFTAVNSNITDVTFFVPGTTDAATTSAFGLVFVDVEVAGATSLEFFDQSGQSIFTADAPTSGNLGLSFLGGMADAGERIGRVRITSGVNTIVSNGVLGNPDDDVVVMDDFIYAEPLAVAAVPEPSALVLAAVGALGLVGALGRRRRPA